MNSRIQGLLALLMGFVSVSAMAQPKTVRWTGADDKNAELNHVLARIKQETGFELSKSDFITVENLDLANNHFEMLAQTAAGTPIKSMAIRIWTDLKTHETVQIEAQLESPVKVAPIVNKFAFFKQIGLLTNSDRALEIARASLKDSDDTEALKIRDASNYWSNGELVRVFKFRGRHGTHVVTVSLAQGKVSENKYQEFPQADEMAIKAQVYPIYEEIEGTPGQLARVPVILKHIKKQVARTLADPYGALNSQQYTADKFDGVLGLTDEGRKQGFWSMTYIKQEAAAIRAALPLVPNSYKTGGVILEGTYATINLHPSVTTKFTGLSFTPALSTQFKPDWTTVAVNGQDTDVMVPRGSLLGKPLLSAGEAFNRPARRLPDHNPVEYINDGFDEIQVYYAINTLFSSLRDGGFTDPELSTRPFNAFLYDPDIAMRDNAFYTDDTINFTTYSPTAQNYARDNSTIWHELGHGVMDRLMGDNIQLADTGGLSEGMADFVADLVIADKTQNQAFPGSENFRIKNHTGFNLTNEVHDDGEAYGGTMHDFLEATIARDGIAGRNKVADVTLEAMRLSRDHPGLTAQDWFQHMLFADSLGHKGVRAPGELHDLIVAAVEARNFSLDGSEAATFTLKQGQGTAQAEVVAGEAGSRSKPIPVSLPESGKASFSLAVALKSSAHYQFKFPLQVRVSFVGGPLQGAIHWDGEEANPKVFTLNSEADLLNFDVAITGKCDFVNREDGSCVDFAYVQIWNAGETDKPSAKKRFYLRLKTATP